MLSAAAGLAPAGRAARLTEALKLWRGPALADFTYESWAQAEIARLENLRLAALEGRLDADLECGRDAELVGELEALVQEHPLRERFRGQLMLALYGAGRQADASRVYQEGRAALVEELGLDPSVELQDLNRAILNQDLELSSSVRVELGQATIRLPVPSTQLIGRATELESLGHLLRDPDVRLIR
jgi:DNA-binding SARP family transcriptional activator